MTTIKYLWKVINYRYLNFNITGIMKDVYKRQVLLIADIVIWVGLNLWWDYLRDRKR